MERLRRINRFWNWLPAFRAVAESEHLPTAAVALGISAPGLSRTIKLLESELGQPLFERRARRLQLNEAGQVFLEHVRDAMRRVDDGCQVLDEQIFVGPLRVSASPSVSLGLVMPALRSLRARYPELVLELLTLDENEISGALRNGAIDVAFLETTEVDPDLSVEQLATCTYNVYCGTSHPLAVRRRVTLEDCLRHPFVGPGDGATDTWPLNLRREVGLRVSSLALAIRSCETGDFLALLPDDTAALEGERLRRLLPEPLVQTPVFVAHMRSLGTRDRIAVFLEAIREAISGVAPPP